MDKKDEKKEKGYLLDSKKGKYIYLIVYLFSFIVSLIMYLNSGDISINLGDFGNIVSLIFLLISLYGFKWIMIFSIVGVIMTILDKFKEINKVYFIIIVFLLFTSFIIKFSFWW